MTLPPRVVDLRGTPPKERSSQVLGALAALEEGEALLLLSDRDPRALYLLLAVRFPEGFSWLPLDEGPPAWRATITRLPPPRFEKRLSSFLRRDQEETVLLAVFLLTDLRAADPEEPVHALAMRARELESRLD